LTATIRQTLYETDSRFDSLVEANFIGQNRIARLRGAKRKKSSFDLIGIHVDLRAIMGRGQVVNRRRNRPFGQFAGEISGMVGRNTHL
jgi:hypothetical protein